MVFKTATASQDWVDDASKTKKGISPTSNFCLCNFCYILDMEKIFFVGKKQKDDVGFDSFLCVCAF